MRELGYVGLSSRMKLHVDSSAAKSFVSRRGLGKMKHLEIRDLWLQKEVREGKVLVGKVPGEENPADLMTKILTKSEIKSRLGRMSIEVGYVGFQVDSVREDRFSSQTGLDAVVDDDVRDSSVRNMICRISHEITSLKSSLRKLRKSQLP